MLHSDRTAPHPWPEVEFTDVQRWELKQLGVLPTQLASLQRTLQIIAPLLEEGAKLQDVRDQVAGLANDLASAMKRWQAVINTAHTLPASRETLIRLNESTLADGRSQSGFDSQLRAAMTADKRQAQVARAMGVPTELIEH